MGEVGVNPANTVPAALPPGLERVLRQFRSMEREEKMQALVQYSRKLEPLPEHIRNMPRSGFAVHECQTPVEIIPESRGGKLHFYADVNARQSPTVAAILAIVLSAVNDQPPETTLAIPSDFVRTVMESIGLGAREAGLNAIIARLKRHALDAQKSAA
jgi:cysteine desulfuration protein SufE